jgi:large subunit ribosomal protein L3
MEGLLGRKIGMTQVFAENGRVQPVTVIEAGPCVVTQLKTQERDGYSAVQVGFGEAKHVKKPQAGHLKASGATHLRYLVEFRQVDDDSQYAVGQPLTVELFQPGDEVDVTGTSKGKGFAGVMKRHGFRGGPKTHGQSDRARAPGSIGPGTTPGRVYKGTRMAGRMGNERRTVQRLAVVEADGQRNLLLVRGSIPGPAGRLVIIRRSAGRG